MFREYNSIKQVKQKRELEKVFQRSDYNELVFCVEEKIHGANFSILLENGTRKFYSRQIEVTNDKFYNWKNILKDEKIIRMIELFESMNFENVQLIGELFGASIQRHIYYSDYVQFRLFDVIINNEYITTEKMCSILKENNLEDCLVPMLETSLTFEQALNYNTIFNSRIANIDDNLCEGIVIKPYNKVITDGFGSNMYFKKKNENFEEINKSKKVSNVPRYSKEVNNARQLFISCFTPQRLDSVESKLGKIMDKKDISKYSEFLTKDSIDEFSSLVDISTFSKEERNFVLNSKLAGGLVFKRYLENTNIV